MAGETYSTAAKGGREREEVVRMVNASLGRVEPVARPVEDGGGGGRGGGKGNMRNVQCVNSPSINQCS